MLCVDPCRPPHWSNNDVKKDHGWEREMGLEQEKRRERIQCTGMDRQRMGNTQYLWKLMLETEIYFEEFWHNSLVKSCLTQYLKKKDGGMTGHHCYLSGVFTLHLWIQCAWNSLLCCVFRSSRISFTAGWQDIVILSDRQITSCYSLLHQRIEIVWQWSSVCSTVTLPTHGRWLTVIKTNPLQSWHDICQPSHHQRSGLLTSPCLCACSDQT